MWLVSGCLPPAVTQYLGNSLCIAKESWLLGELFCASARQAVRVPRESERKDRADEEEGRRMDVGGGEVRWTAFKCLGSADTCRDGVSFCCSGHKLCLRSERGVVVDKTQTKDSNLTK